MAEQPAAHGSSMVLPALGLLMLHKCLLLSGARLQYTVHEDRWLSLTGSQVPSDEQASPACHGRSPKKRRQNAPTPPMCPTNTSVQAVLFCDQIHLVLPLPRNQGLVPYTPPQCPVLLLVPPQGGRSVASSPQKMSVSHCIEVRNCESMLPELMCTCFVLIYCTPQTSDLRQCSLKAPLCALSVPQTGRQKTDEWMQCIKTLLLCMMRMAPSASMHVSVNPRSLGGLQQATDRP